MNSFENFLQVFEKLLADIMDNKPDFTLVLGDFNVKSTTWCDKDTTTLEGTHIEALTLFYGFHQIISEPAHILPNSTSCIDLIFF